MSTDTEAGNETGDDDLREQITNFLRQNFPQIQMHGGSAAIEDLDRDTGKVSIQLGGACSGCGISPDDDPGNQKPDGQGNSRHRAG